MTIQGKYLSYRRAIIKQLLIWRQDQDLLAKIASNSVDKEVRHEIPKVLSCQWLQLIIFPIIPWVIKKKPLEKIIRLALVMHRHQSLYIDEIHSIRHTRSVTNRDHLSPLSNNRLSPHSQTSLSRKHQTTINLSQRPKSSPILSTTMANHPPVCFLLSSILTMAEVEDRLQSPLCLRNKFIITINNIISHNTTSITNLQCVASLAMVTISSWTAIRALMYQLQCPNTLGNSCMSSWALPRPNLKSS